MKYHLRELIDAIQITQVRPGSAGTELYFLDLMDGTTTKKNLPAVANPKF